MMITNMTSSTNAAVAGRRRVANKLQAVTSHIAKPKIPKAASWKKLVVVKESTVEFEAT